MIGKRSTGVLGSFLILTGAVSCSSAGEAGPEQTITTFYEAADAGRYEDAQNHASEETIRNVEGALGAMGGGWKGILDEATRNGALTRVEVTSTEVRGDGATCEVVKHFEDGSTENRTIELIREGGAWKIAWSTEQL